MGYTPENNPYIPGDPYSYDLKWMVDRIKALTDPTLSAQEAEAWAVGTKDGEPVDSDAPQYDNNSKYYASDAEMSKISAGIFKNNSEAWAVGTKDGYPVTAEDEQYENNSKYYAEQASDSAQEAKDYADNIADPVSGIVTDWLTDHITNPSSPPVDTSLSVGGAAADAAATGDALALIQQLELNYDIAPAFQIGYAYRLGTGDTPDVNTPTANTGVACSYIACQEGDVITLNITAPAGTNYRGWGFIDASQNIIERAPSGAVTYTNHQVIAPADTAYIVINANKNYDYSAFRGMQVYNELLDIRGDISALQGSPYAGKRMSILGDSFSAYSGYSTDGHNYYPVSASDVSSVNEMWWKIVADQLQMTPLVIGAWSGSCVTSGVRNDSTYKPASDPYRCEALHSGVQDPDLILIAMGVNDYSYMDNVNEFGTWDGKTALGTQADLSDYVNTDFRSAYATMLARIQHAYPAAQIVCITPFFQERYYTSVGVNFLNEISKDIREYADTVREICRIMHVACIDGTDIGFNWNNYYPTYAADSSTHPTHPTVAGQAVIADAVIKQLKQLAE